MIPQASYHHFLLSRVFGVLICLFGFCTCIGFVIAMVRSGARDIVAGSLCATLVILGVWFGQLTRRAWRTGIDLTEVTVRIRKLFWDRVIPLDQIKSLSVEEWYDAESGTSRWHVARDASGRTLFTLRYGVPKLDELIGSVRSGCGMPGSVKQAEPGAASDSRG